MNKSQKDFYKLFSEHGAGDAKVTITPAEVMMLTVRAVSDLGLMPECGSRIMEDIAAKDFYEVTAGDIDSLPAVSADACFEYMRACGVTDIDNVLFSYLKNLCDLYRRRMKYRCILRSQPFPAADQIVPRSLLEYGSCDNRLLADWLEWRKWIFDIDNRSAQETGYVFEPILAGCLGGESVSAKNSPVKRIDDNGDVTGKGRQIDCYIEDAKEVYELKMRVTIAASGQGRFNEEMSFPLEADRAGLTPILVVFDGTESELLAKLKKRYADCGGRCYIGKEAWSMLQERAGKEMGVFINKYIYPPIHSMEKVLGAEPESIVLSRADGKISIKGEHGEYVIGRTD